MGRGRRWWSGSAGRLSPTQSRGTGAAPLGIGARYRRRSPRRRERATWPTTLVPDAPRATISYFTGGVNRAIDYPMRGAIVRPVNLTFRHADHERIATEAGHSGGLPPEVVRAFRKVVQGLRSATDQRDIRSMKSWRLEKLKGDRKHQHSIRLNKQWRLILELMGTGASASIGIEEIENHYR